MKIIAGSPQLKFRNACKDEHVNDGNNYITKISV